MSPTAYAAMGGVWSEEEAPELPEQVVLQVRQGESLEAGRELGVGGLVGSWVGLEFLVRSVWS